VLSFLLLLYTASDLLPTAYAESQMTPSQSCVDFIKAVEGFASQPYYDYGQHTVGYGTKCPTEKYLEYHANGIPVAEAEALLQESLAEITETIHTKLMDPYDLQFTQHQFDALVSFTFNLGPSWMTYDSTLRNALLSNAGEDELIYAFSLYSTAGGNYLSGLVSRRLCEANIYLNGVYSKTVHEDYGYVYYEPNGGSLTYQVQGFNSRNQPQPIAEAVRRGDVFTGWYTDLTGGIQVNTLTKDLSGKTLFARWQSSENTEEQSSQTWLVRVTGDVVNIRKGPGTNYGIAKQVYSDDLLIVSQTTQLTGRKWGKVRDGWICLEYTDYDSVVNPGTQEGNAAPPSDDAPAPVTPPASADNNTTAGDTTTKPAALIGTVQVNDLLRVRSGPGTSYPVVAYLSNNQKVEILEQTKLDSSFWGHISSGWVCMDYIRKNSQSNSSPEPDASAPNPPADNDLQTDTPLLKGTITADALRIRSGAGANTPIVGFYYHGDLVTITDKISVNSVFWGKTDKGWISMEFVSAATEEDPSNAGTGTMTVIADCLRVRKEIGTDSRIAELLYYGDTVTVLETKAVDGMVWGRVSNGWICMDYVQ